MRISDWSSDVCSSDLTIDGAPKFNSVEALLRWEHPEHGPISPEEFIPIAETSGQMPALGDWVIAQVLKDISRWPGLQVAINLSPVQLKADGFVRRVIRLAAAAHVTPSPILFEVTEHVMMTSTGHVRKRVVLGRWGWVCLNL